MVFPAALFMKLREYYHNYVQIFIPNFTQIGL